MQRVGLSAERKTDRVLEPASWCLEGENHRLILHEGGLYHGLETWLDGRRTSLGAPIPGEFWLAPAGRCYKAAANSGVVHYLAISLPVADLPLVARSQFLAAHRSAPMAALAKGVLAKEPGANSALTEVLFEEVDGRRAAAPIPAAIGRRIDDLLAFIEANLDQPLTVAAMAADTGMSVNALLVHFARATGRTPAQYLLHQRIRHACSRLLNAQDSIASVAFASGFSSHAHLSAIFRQKLGLSPSDWRRQSVRGARN